MTHSPFSSFSVCAALLAALVGLQACKHAPLAPDLSSRTQSNSSHDDEQNAAAAAAELKRLEQERADLVAEQKQLEADIRLAEKGWPEGQQAPVIQEEVKYGSTGKGQDEEIVEAKKEVNKCTKKGDRKGAREWFKKLKERCKAKKDKVDQKVVDVDVKIGKTKSQMVDYSGVVPGPITEPPGAGDPVFAPPTQDGPVPTQADGKNQYDNPEQKSQDDYESKSQSGK